MCGFGGGGGEIGEIIGVLFVTPLMGSVGLQRTLFLVFEDIKVMKLRSALPCRCRVRLGRVRVPQLNTCREQTRDPQPVSSPWRCLCPLLGSGEGNGW